MYDYHNCSRHHFQYHESQLFIRSQKDKSISRTVRVSSSPTALKINRRLGSQGAPPFPKRHDLNYQSIGFETPRPWNGVKVICKEGNSFNSKTSYVCFIWYDGNKTETIGDYVFCQVLNGKEAHGSFRYKKVVLAQYQLPICRRNGLMTFLLYNGTFLPDIWGLNWLTPFMSERFLLI